MLSWPRNDFLLTHLFHALHYAQPRSTRRLLLQWASKLDCTPSLDKYFPPCVCEPLLRSSTILSSKPIFGDVDYVYLRSDGSSPLPWASIKVKSSLDDIHRVWAEQPVDCREGHPYSSTMIVTVAWAIPRITGSLLALTNKTTLTPPSASTGYYT